MRSTGRKAVLALGLLLGGSTTVGVEEAYCHSMA